MNPDEVEERLNRIRAAAIVVASRSRLLLEESKICGKITTSATWDLWREGVEAYSAILDEVIEGKGDRHAR